MITKLPKYVAFDLGSVRETRIGNFIRDEFETGPVQQRRLGCVPSFELTGTIRLCDDHYSDFWCWFEDILCSGTQWFKMKHPVSGVEGTYRFAGNELEFRYIPNSIYEAQITLERIGK